MVSSSVKELSQFFTEADLPHLPEVGPVIAGLQGIGLYCIVVYQGPRQVAHFQMGIGVGVTLFVMGPAIHADVHGEVHTGTDQETVMDEDAEIPSEIPGVEGDELMVVALEIVEHHQALEPTQSFGEIPRLQVPGRRHGHIHLFPGPTPSGPAPTVEAGRVDIGVVEVGPTAVVLGREPHHPVVFGISGEQQLTKRKKVLSHQDIVFDDDTIGLVLEEPRDGLIDGMSATQVAIAEQGLHLTVPGHGIQHRLSGGCHQFRLARLMGPGTVTGQVEACGLIGLYRRHRPFHMFRATECQDQNRYLHLDLFMGPPPGEEALQVDGEIMFETGQHPMVLPVEIEEFGRSHPRRLT